METSPGASCSHGSEVPRAVPPSSAWHAPYCTLFIFKWEQHYFVLWCCRWVVTRAAGRHGAAREMRSNAATLCSLTSKIIGAVARGRAQPTAAWYWWFLEEMASGD